MCSRCCRENRDEAALLVGDDGAVPNAEQPEVAARTRREAAPRLISFIVFVLVLVEIL